MLPLALAILLLLTVAPTLSFAHCPLCTIATGSTLAIAKAMGVSDLAVGTMAGVFTVSTALWFDVMVRKKNKGKDVVRGQSHLIVVGSMAMTIGSYMVAGFTSDMARLLPPLDDLMAGTIVGSVLGLLAFVVHGRLRAANKNRNHVPFQVVFVLVGTMLLAIVAYAAMGYLMVN